MMLKKRNIAFFAATLINFIFLLVATLAIGFKQYKGPRFWLGDLANPSYRLTSNPIFDYSSHNFSFINASFGLIITGIVLAGLVLILATVVFSWTMMRWAYQVPIKTYYWIEGTIVAVTIIAVIFVFTGELLFITRYYYVYRDAQWRNDAFIFYDQVPIVVYRFKDMWQITSFVWMLILTFLPILTIVAPYTFSWKFLKRRRRWFRRYKEEEED